MVEMGKQFDHVTCDNCGDQHVAGYSHDSPHGQGPIYEVTCPKDNLADYYTSERLEAKRKTPKKTRTAKNLGLQHG